MLPINRAFPENIAHRGFHSQHQENSLKAFQEAFELGCDGAELDVRLTADQQVVVFHDSDLKRISKGVDLRQIMDCSAQELQKYTIPTFQEVVDLAKKYHKKLYIELKHEAKGHETLVAKTLQILYVSDALKEGWCIISFHEPYLMRVLQNELPVSLGLTFRPEEDYSIDYLLQKATGLQLEMLLLHYSLLDEKKCKRLNDEGVRIGVLGNSNEIEKIKETLAYGVDCVMTDIPDKVAELKRSLE